MERLEFAKSVAGHWTAAEEAVWPMMLGVDAMMPVLAIACRQVIGPEVETSTEATAAVEAQ